MGASVTQTIRRAGSLVARGAVTLGRGFWMTVAVLALAAGAVWLLGGFAPAHRDPAPLAAVAPGDAHVSDQVTVRILSAELTDDPELFLEEGAEALRVQLEVTNNWTRPLGTTDVIDQVLEFPQVPEQKPDRTSRADGGAIGWLQPAVPTPILLQWEAPAGAIDPDAGLRVIVSDGRLRQFQLIDDSWTWVDHRPAAEVDVPIADRTGATS
ncbi:hypothetical protein [Microbacterium sp. JZ31]|uniref:hypothetical protein n=1 Tax=Microbacterium sp. JZ31 TaxID=1906274 RepID=UPI0019335761|nr:hypothetical protein [Microbacterium sp. JZ31]